MSELILPGQNLPGVKPIYARSGWQIPCEFRLPKKRKLTEIQNQEYLKWTREYHRVLRSSSIYFYNCVGMIFASRRAWIEIDHVMDILRHDNYKEIKQSEVKPGDVVLYYYSEIPAHIGMIMHVPENWINITVMSKFGEHQEFLHFITDTPDIYGTPGQYWTDRV